MKKVILVADDSIDICDFLEIFLTRDGYEVLTAANGHEALEVLSQRKVDLVISDFEMHPGINGIELYKIIQEEGKIPFILMSSLDLSDLSKDEFAGEFFLKACNLMDIGILVKRIFAEG